MGKMVGFIGLGNMGLPMATLLLKDGYNIQCFDKNESACHSLQEMGAIKATVADMTTQADTMILMLPNSQIVNGVIEQITDSYSPLDRNGRELTIIDMSSSFPLDTQANAAKLSHMGIHLLDAPVSGGVKKAITGQLTIMVGGSEEVYANCYDLLKVMGEQVYYTGPSGSGHLIKALNNYLSAAHMLATCEAVHTLTQFGVDPKVGIEVFNHSSGRSGSSEYKFPQFVLNEAYNSGFSLELLAKDVGIAKAMLDEVSDSTPLMKLLYHTYTQAKDTLGGQPDHTEIFRFVSTYTKFKKGD